MCDEEVLLLATCFFYTTLAFDVVVSLLRAPRTDGIVLVYSLTRLVALPCAKATASLLSPM